MTEIRINLDAPRAVPANQPVQKTGKMGSHIVEIDHNPPIDLAKLDTRSIPFQGFRTATKLQRAAQGLQQRVSDTLKELCGGRQYLDIKTVARTILTVQEFLDRQVTLGAFTAAKVDSQFLAAFASQISSLGNDQLRLLYQQMISPAMEQFQQSLLREIAAKDIQPKQLARLQALYTNLCHLEALSLQEVATRIARAKLPTDQVASLPTLTERHPALPLRENDVLLPGTVHQPAAPINPAMPDRSGLNVNDMTMLVGKGAAESIHSKIALQTTRQVLEKHQIPGADAVKQFGDMVRDSELTINFSTTTLLALANQDENGNFDPLGDPTWQIKNVFQIKSNVEQLTQDEITYMETRNFGETTFFPHLDPEKTSGVDRPIYGALNMLRSQNGAAVDYGGVVFVMKPEVKRRATYTVNDSLLAMPAKITDDRIEQFLQLFANQPNVSKEDKEKLTQKNPPSALRLAIFDFFRQKANHPLLTLEHCKYAKELLGAIHNTATNNRFDPWCIQALMAKAFVDTDRCKDYTATYDHIENLMMQMTEYQSLYFAKASIDHFQHPNDGGIQLQGSTYIEAQVHGSIVLGRDIEAIRLSPSDLVFDIKRALKSNPAQFGARYQHFCAEHTELSPKAAASQFAALEANRLIERFKVDCKRMGIRLEFYEDDENASRLHELTDANSTNSMNFVTQEKTKDFTQRLAQMRTPEKQRQFFQEMLSQHSQFMDAFENQWGHGLENLPEKYRKYILEPLENAINGQMDFGDKQDFSDVTRTLSGTCADRLAILHSLLTSCSVLEARQEIAFASPEKKEAFMDYLLGQPLISELKLKSISDRIFLLWKSLFDQRQQVLEGCGTLLSSQVLPAIPGYDNIKDLLGEKPIVGGAAASRLAGTCLQAIQEIEDALNDLDFSATTETLADKLKNDAQIKKMLETKVRLLQSIQNFQFESTADRDAFVGWVLNSMAVKSDVELELIFDASTILQKELRAIKQSDQPLDTAKCVAVFNRLFQVFVEKTPALQKLHHNAMEKDDVLANAERAVSVAFSRLLATETFSTPAELEAFFKTGSATHFQNAVFAISSEIASFTQDSTPELESDRNYLFLLDAAMRGAFSTFDRLNPLPNGKWRNIPVIPIEAITPQDRAVLRQCIPVFMDKIDANFPHDSAKVARQRPIQPPQKPELLPTTLEGREKILLKMLPKYREHERTFDKGTNYHGRTHVTRAFVLGNVMANILREKGIKVDMAAVSAAIAGHDSGRSRNGIDVEENKSAQITRQMLQDTYPDIGQEWLEDIALAINHGNGLPKTIEGYLLICADSLDFERVSPIDEKFFPFLQIPLETAEGYQPMDKKLRQALIKESKLLSKLTDQRVARREEQTQLELQMLDADDEHLPVIAQQLTQLKEEVRMAEINQTESMSDEQILQHIKAVIAENAKDFPLLSKYYKD